MIITEELRAKILLHLPADYLKKGKEETGYSKSMIYKVLHEGHENDTISQWLVATAKTGKVNKEKSHKSIYKIASQL